MDPSDPRYLRNQLSAVLDDLFTGFVALCVLCFVGPLVLYFLAWILLAL